jgi:signal transduction histidine kinase
MSTATWGEPEPHTDETYPSSLLKHLLQQMMRQFAADGGCIALFDPGLGQMVVRLHMRLRSANMHTTYNGIGTDSLTTNGLRSAASPAHQTGPVRQKLNMPGSPDVGIFSGGYPTPNLQGTQPLRLPSDPSLSAVERQRRPAQPSDELEIIASSNGDLFPLGVAYPYGQDLIGFTWRSSEPEIMRHADYLTSFHTGRATPFLTDATPNWYLSVPISEPLLVDDIREKKRVPAILGVVVLYQTNTGPGFQQKQRQEALLFAERIALYLQNDHLRRSQERMNDHMKRLQQISTAFPTTVKLSKLVEDMYSFVNAVVDVSSMLLTFYDRDTNKIYDVFAVNNGQRVEGLTMKPIIATPEERPIWWRLTQQEKRTLSFSPVSLESGVIENVGDGTAADEALRTSHYDELLQGTWGDQRKAESFLLLPMKMFTRVIGSLMLTSTRPRAFEREEIVVLETMVQIITVSIENAKLYERSRQSLQEARYREESLAAMYSALQAISSVLNLKELLHKFVETVVNLVQAEMCSYFQLSPDGKELIAQAIYDTTGKWKNADPSSEEDEHDDLISMIHLPFKGSVLEELAQGTFFYLDPSQAEELAQISGEGGAIFLHETTPISKMLMIPVHYQAELVGILAVHTPRQDRVFRPKEISVLLAICAQAASAIRNAQLFEQIQEAYAELQRMDKLKDEFIVTASHELRTPLSAISGYSSLLKRQSGRINQQQILRFASKIGSSAQQLIDLVANMTEAAKMGAHDKKLDLQMGPVQVLAAAELAMTMLSINIEQEISLYIKPDLWVTCDPLHLRQVLTNLLDNAAKYSPPSGRIMVMASTMMLSQVPLPEDQVNLALLAGDGGDIPVVRVRVCDEGPGIPPEDQQKIFEKFVRTSSSLTTPVRGSGLGLYICRRYIEAMGGKLWLERSVPGEGSVFSFYLPRIEAPIEVSEQDEPAGETPTH